MLQLHVNDLYKEQPSVTSKQTSFITTQVILQPFRQLELLCATEKFGLITLNSNYRDVGVQTAGSDYHCDRLRVDMLK